MSVEFTIGDYSYRGGTLDAMKQFHIVRRLTPLLGALQGADLAALRDAAGDQAADSLAALVGPMTQAIAAMSDADTEFVLATCMAVVQREQGRGLGWAPVWSVQAKRPMYDDITLPVMLQIVAKVLMDNVSGFTSALPQTSPAAVPASR